VTREIRFARTADADLDRIWAYIAENDAFAADGLIDRLRSSAGRLATYPQSAPVRLNIGFDVRGISAHHHILLYVFDDNTVTIIRVFDARQNWQALLLS
jgi:toxin ParE1/3/4